MPLGKTADWVQLRDQRRLLQTDLSISKIGRGFLDVLKLGHTRHRWAVLWLNHSLDHERQGSPSIQFNDHESAFRLCLAAQYSGSGLGLQIQGQVCAAPPAAAATPGGALRRVVDSVKRCDLQIQGSDL